MLYPQSSPDMKKKEKHQISSPDAELELGGPRAGRPRLGGAELGVGPTTFLRYECVHMRAGPAVPWLRPDDYRTADLELFQKSQIESALGGLAI